MLVSISVVVLMSGLFLADYHSANKRSALVNAAQKMASDIRLAQQFSSGAREFNGVPSAGGWGVYFNKTTPDYYIIFADINAPAGNKSYDTGEMFKQINLPAGVSIDSIIDEEDTALNAVAVTFLPPDPITYIAASLNKKARIALRDVNTNSVKTAEVNFLGLVEIIN